MSSCKYLLLFAFIVLTRFGSTHASLFRSLQGKENATLLEDEENSEILEDKENAALLEDEENSALLEDKENDKKYIAYEETLELIKKFEKISRSAPSSGANFTSVFGEISIEDFAPTRTFVPNANVSGKQLKLLLYTPEQPDGIELDIHNLEEMEFDPSKPTRIICHGWRSSANELVVRSITQAYINKGNNNVIGVDWSSYSENILYPFPVKKTEGVGKYVANIIDALVEKRKANYSDFHIIGHSLGAHLAGFAGSNTKEKVGRITGLDPALPGFQYMQKRNGRLDDTDAHFVDVIHTCSGLLGMSVPVGHVDFYPNGGSPFQPGCTSFIIPQTNTCSHGRSYEYFAESIANSSEFSAIKCKDWGHFKKNHCKRIYTLMGDPVSKDARGIFYLTTNDHAPFAQGLNGTIY